MISNGVAKRTSHSRITIAVDNSIIFAPNLKVNETRQTKRNTLVGLVLQQQRVHSKHHYPVK